MISGMRPEKTTLVYPGSPVLSTSESSRSTGAGQERTKMSRKKKPNRNYVIRIPFRGLALAAGTLFYLVAPRRAPGAALAPFVGKNFAHRGLHTEDKAIPENSLAAFDAACRKGYGSELDVQLSADGKVFVFHDDTLGRVTGAPGVAEDQPWDYLKDLKLCGTDETIPLFRDVLETVDGRTPLIVEFKATDRYPELCEKALDLLLESREKTGLDFCVESFDPRIVRWFKEHAPLIVRGQLSAPAENLVPADAKPVKKAEAFVCANLLTNFLTRPNFIAYRVGPKPFPVAVCRKLGAPLVVWTSLDPAEEETADCVIFQFYEPSPSYR